MKQEKTLLVVTLIILALLIAATVICAIKYMHEEPSWNRDPVPAVAEAPEAGLQLKQSAKFFRCADFIL